jgi:hypothetical protein
MRKVPSMIRHGNHLSNGNTSAGTAHRHGSKTFFCDLPGRIATSNFRCSATTLDDRAGMILCPFPARDVR